MANWQPIETAPKDGSEIDLWVIWPADEGQAAEARRQADAHWDDDAQDWQIDSFRLGQYMARPYATHWMEVPEGPAA